MDREAALSFLKFESLSFRSFVRSFVEIGGGGFPLKYRYSVNEREGYRVVLLIVLLINPVIIKASLDPVFGPREHPIVESFGYDINSNITKLDRELWEVVLQGDLNLQNISSLLSNGADPNSYDEQHQTALHRAAWKGQRLTISLLCAKGAFVDVQDAWIRTPLHFAAAFGK